MAATTRTTQPPRAATAREVFGRIYTESLWGNSPDAAQPFFSGSGSHDPAVVATYLQAISQFLATLPAKPDVVDLGCGDFSIGSRIRPLCAKYCACDVVPELIEFNRERFAALQVGFTTLDLTVDELPGADIAFVRQVFQHLSNDQILLAIGRIAATYRYLILTEHLPATAAFEHNLDKPAGPDIRLAIGSGIVLASHPFNLRPVAERQLCRAAELGGLIVTTLYAFR